MKLEELYAKYDEIVGKMNITPIDHFIFDLTDENSQKSLKENFPGIEAILMPEAGKYLVAAPVVEKEDCLVLLFPQKTDGSVGLWAYNTKTKGKSELTDGGKATLEDFTADFARMEDITKRFNEFAFMSNGEDSTTEVKDIGSFDISNDEPVEINNTTTDNEENEMTKFKPIQEASLDSELKDTKWVEIPNTTAHGVTVTEDDGNPENPFADDAAGGGDAAPADGGDAAPVDDTAVDAPADGGDAAPATTDVDAAAEPAPEAPAEEAPADTGAETIDDPKAKMRELLAYYTNYMNELVQDPNTSTDLISATQEMIDSLIKNMESADGIEEVKADQEEAAKDEVAVDDAPAEETPAEEPAPAEGETAPAEEPVAESVVTEGFFGGLLGGIAGFFLGGGLLGTVAGAAAGSKLQNFFHKRDVIKNLDDVQLLILASCKEAAADGVTADDLKKALAKNKDVDIKKEVDGLVDVGVIKKNGDTIMITAEGKKVLQEAGYDEKAVQQAAKAAQKNKDKGEGEGEGEGEGDQKMAAEGTGMAIVGGAAGAALGGPLGAAVGAGLGSTVEEGTGCAIAGGAAGAALGGPVGAAVGAGLGSLVESDDEQAKLDAKIDAEVDDLHKDDWEDIAPATSDDILTPGDLRNSPVNDVALDDVPPTPDEELAATTPDETAPAPTSDVLDDTALPSPDETVDLLGTDDIDEYGVGADGLPIDDYAGDVPELDTMPSSKKVAWSQDYALNGIATTDDNNVVVPGVLNELSEYYKKVADEVSKVPGKEDVAMKLQKIQILSQTIQTEWNSIVSQIGDVSANSYDLSNMGDLEKDELASQDALSQVSADVMADQEKEEEDDLEIYNQIQSFAESFKHLI